ncbi:hypothetical protein GCK32_022756, partial [Trichostrongylus colubriformis]
KHSGSIEDVGMSGDLNVSSTKKDKKNVVKLEDVGHIPKIY